MFDEFFTKAQELRSQSRPFATATVVRAEKPTSGKPGDKAIITLDGIMYGWIGGSCAQPTVVREALKAIADDRSRLIRLSPDPNAERATEGVEVLPMTCYSGGTLDVYIEPQQPQPRLLIIGNLPVAQALAHLGKAMAHRVIAFDPEGGGAMAAADEVVLQLEGLAEHITPLTYVVVATHGNHDEPAVDLALRAGATYVGLIASPKRAEGVRKYLRLTGLSDEDLAPLKAPAGLDIGARRGDEIALSIMAEIVQRRRAAERLEWPEEASEETPDGSGTSPATAIDPICGMSVVKEGAAHTFEHEGVTYYFCCGGCQSRFLEQPQDFVSVAAG